MSTAYLPPIEYFYFLNKSDAVNIEQFETYKKQTYRNRCRIYTEKGDTQLSIPVIKTFGNHTKVKDIQIFRDENWQKSHWKAITSAYQASPYFLYYMDDLSLIYQKKYKFLLDFNNDLLKIIFNNIGISIPLSLTNDFIKPLGEPNDFRYLISPKEDQLIEQYPSYMQVFDDRHGFIPNLSIIDLLFNLGPETRTYLNGLKY